MQPNGTSVHLYVDPVCFMKVIPRKDLKHVHNLRNYYFCAEGCRKAFAADPEQYLDPSKRKRKGLWTRYLDRLGQTTKGQCLKCH